MIEIQISFVAFTDWKNISMGVIQMMISVLSSDYFVYHCMQKVAGARVYRQSYHVNSKITSIILTAVDHILGQQQCFACDAIQSTRTTAQEASFESSL